MRRNDRHDLTQSEAPNPDQDISLFLDKVRQNYAPAPLLVAGVAQWTTSGWMSRFGWSGNTAGHSALQVAFDLASVSKSFLAVLCAQCVSKGYFSWSTALRQVLPEVSGLWAADQSLEALLSHRSGLDAHVELFRPSWSGLPIRRTHLLRVAAGRRSNKPIGQPLYSDLGYILAAAAIERVARRSLDQLLYDEVLGPWGIEAGSARSFRKHHVRFVPTEIQPGRGGALLGVVHDDNAWALGGSGFCGHAGLFGTLPGVLKFGRILLDAHEGRTGPLDPLVLEPLTRSRPGGTLKMGFDGVSGSTSMAGAQAGPETFGHLGFTGTSFWCDPSKGRVTVLLSNRVSPTRDNPRIKVVRPKIHDFLWTC